MTDHFGFTHHSAMRDIIARIIPAALLAILLGGCLHIPVHQGNRLDANEINMIQTGDTKFAIEQKLGSPALNSLMHPHRVTYFEMYEDEESGEMRKRGVEITYDSAWRASEIRRFGFDDATSGQQ